MFQLSGSNLKEYIGSFIWRKLGTLGLITGAQIFAPSQFLHAVSISSYRSFVTFEESIQYGTQHPPQGTNMIGILPGKFWGTSKDQILVVGAHWDTVENTGGLDDNGSGVAALLEIARALKHGNCALTYSVVFVAFDLEEYGSQGSLYFVQDFLIEKVMKEGGFPQFKGAIIMDSILHYNSTQNSQNVEDDWFQQVPNAVENILSHQGDQI